MAKSLYTGGWSAPVAKEEEGREDLCGEPGGEDNVAAPLGQGDCGIGKDDLSERVSSTEGGSIPSRLRMWRFVAQQRIPSPTREKTR